MISNQLVIISSQSLDLLLAHFNEAKDAREAPDEHIDEECRNDERAAAARERVDPLDLIEVFLVDHERSLQEALLALQVDFLLSKHMLHIGLFDLLNGKLSASKGARSTLQSQTGKLKIVLALDELLQLSREMRTSEHFISE